MSKIFNVALIALLITSSTNIFASSKLFSKAGIHLKNEDEESVITIGKSAAYTLATIGTYVGASIIGVDWRTKIIGTAGVGLIGLGDVAKNKPIQNLGVNTLLAALAVWTTTGRYTKFIPEKFNEGLGDHIPSCIATLVYFTLYRSACNLAVKGYKHYKNKK